MKNLIFNDLKIQKISIYKLILKKIENKKNLKKIKINKELKK